MEMMGYDALNLGGPEFYFGKEALEHTRSHVSFPYIASNLLFGGSRLPWTEEYIIREAGGIKVAILGVMNPDELVQIPDQGRVKGLEVLPPEPALKKLLAEVRGRSDLVVLLSRFDVEKTRELVVAVGGIDVAIASGGDEVFYTKPLENAILLQTGALGRTMGLLKVALDEKGKVGVIERGHVRLDRTVPDDQQVARLVDTFKKAQGQRDAEAAEQRRRELMEGLRLSPEEFMERYRKEQTGSSKGEAR
jgi:2',3'-cyclic-nucleotide 2'-phosphodiesterase (5'-nucleotidase family)